MKPLQYDSLSPVLRYNAGLFYGQLLPSEKGSVMARISAKIRRFGFLQLLQFIQNLITAATGNANAPTPNPKLVLLQGLYDDGVEKNNDYQAAQDACTAALAVRDEFAEEIIAGLNAYFNDMESHTQFNAVKLQSLGLPLRATPTPTQACGTVTGLITTVGDEEGVLNGKWKAQAQAISYEVQITTDPMTPNSWAYVAPVATRARKKITGLTSGQKYWIRVRAVNDQGPGPWSDPSCRMVP